MRLFRQPLVLILLLAGLAASARAADAPYVQTPWNVVDAMFGIAGVGPNDYLMDLGSGDGRVVITAAKKLGARGFGVELDPNLVRNARREAERQGVSDRVAFEAEDLFFIDLGKATVITIYMSESVNLRLRPSLFKLKPGTRIVSHDFDMAQWQPDEKQTVAVPNKPYGAPRSEVFLWVVPADVSGRWRWQSTLGAASVDYDAAFEQTFQMLSGSVQAAGRNAQLRDARVRGETVSFTLLAERDGRSVRQQFSGRLAGDVIEGRAIVDGAEIPWRATRSARGRLNIDAAIGAEFLRIVQGSY